LASEDINRIFKMSSRSKMNIQREREEKFEKEYDATALMTADDIDPYSMDVHLGSVMYLEDQREAQYK